MQDDLPDDLITTPHAARLVKLHISGVRRWIFTKRVQGYRRGGRWYVSRAELLAQWQTAGEVLAQRQAERPPGTRRASKQRDDWARKILAEAGVKGRPS